MSQEDEEEPEILKLSRELKEAKAKLVIENLPETEHEELIEKVRSKNLGHSVNRRWVDKADLEEHTYA